MVILKSTLSNYGIADHQLPGSEVKTKLWPENLDHFVNFMDPVLPKQNFQSVTRVMSKSNIEASSRLSTSGQSSSEIGICFQ